MDYWDRLFLYRKKLLLPYVNIFVEWMTRLTYLCATVFLAAVVYELGFLITPAEKHFIHVLYHIVWVMFLFTTALQFLFRQEGDEHFTGWRCLLNILLLLTLLPVVFHEPQPGNFAYWLWHFLRNPYYRGVILLLLSLSQLSGSLVRLMGKHTNPSLILACSFLILILVGTGLLMLPKATVNGISWVDAFFTATSVTCVTGLSTVDATATFTPLGQIIIIALVQIGGLGVMTITCFFAMFFMGNTSLYNQLVVGDMISSDSLNSLISTLLYILGFTLAIEGMGMAVIWFGIHNELGIPLEQELYFAAFHAICAFCNCGFSNMTGNVGYISSLPSHNLIYITLSLLIILGGIGFPILVNLKGTIFYYLRYAKWWVFSRRKRRFQKQVHLYNFNTKIVLAGTVLLLIGGTLAIAAFEWNHSFGTFSTADKWVQAFFNATVPRTAGFNSVDPATFTPQTLLLIIVLMMIGGGTQSTAGGIKINVFAVIVINLFAVLRGADHTTFLHRQLAHESLRRANCVFVLYLVLASVSVFLMSVFEPEASLLALAYECVSALGTVGTSLNLTPLLSTPGKFVIIILMFIGRVGAFTLLIGLIKQKKIHNYRYPIDNIIIN